jgi:ATP-binding protein involved in chromosome partitioning
VSALRKAVADLWQRRRERLAKEVGLPLLGQIPLFARVLEGGDSGAPIVLSDPQSSAARALFGIAEGVAEQLGALANR